MAGYMSSARKAAMHDAYLSDPELHTILRKVFRELNIRFGSVGAALRSLNIDKQGGIDVNEVNTLFDYCGMEKRTAGRFFSRHVKPGRLTIPVQMLRELLDPEAGSANSSRRSSFDGQVFDTQEEIDLNTKLHIHQSAQDKKNANSIVRNLELLGVAAVRRNGGSLRKAFLGVDRDRSGYVTKKEIRDFYRTYGFGDKDADIFFEYVDVDNSGSISYQEFVHHFLPFFHPEEFLHTKNTYAGACRQADMEKHLANRVPLPEELEKVISNIGHSIARKHKTVQSAFTRVDRNHDGTILRDSVRNFFRSHGYPAKAIADMMFDHLDRNRIGLIEMHEFQSYFSKYLWVNGEPGDDFPIDQFTGTSATHSDHGITKLKLAYDDQW